MCESVLCGDRPSNPKAHQFNHHIKKRSRGDRQFSSAEALSFADHKLQQKIKL
ncbi:MAG: hypothetical protein HC878_12875 [Leptolyngbyaceae cyanobacterium SL_5_14]|nr:hypothetical protein [Leptolyngbyaceae cyanobacterium SL_5_14]